MKLVTFLSSDVARIGVLQGGDVIDLVAVHQLRPCFSAEAMPALSDMVALIRRWPEVHGAVRECVATSVRHGIGRRPARNVKMLAPITPTTILCSGSNYLSHNREKANADISGKEPEFFVKTADCVVGPGEPIVHDQVLTQKLDGEVELAIVIGKPGRHIRPEEALDHVFGYTVVNDVTARDRQVRRRPDGTYWYDLGRGKVFDTSAPLGPCIATSDEIPDPQNLALRSWVNKELRQSSRTSQMIWTCAQLVHFFSMNLTLRPGMVIITGTPSGTAWSTDAELGGKWSGDGVMVPARGYLKRGDVISCEIEEIGRLVNPVA